MRLPARADLMGLMGYEGGHAAGRRILAVLP